MVFLTILHYDTLFRFAHVWWATHFWGYFKYLKCKIWFKDIMLTLYWWPNLNFTTLTLFLIFQFENDLFNLWIIFCTKKYFKSLKSTNNIFINFIKHDFSKSFNENTRSILFEKKIMFSFQDILNWIMQ